MHNFRRLIMQKKGGIRAPNKDNGYTFRSVICLSNSNLRMICAIVCNKLRISGPAAKNE